MPAYHYDSGMGLTLYHHDHYVHYSVVDMVIRAVLSLIVLIVFCYLICFLVGVCDATHKESEYQPAYANEPDEEAVVIEEKVEVIHHADGAITENRTVATTQYDYHEPNSDYYQHAN